MHIIQISWLRGKPVPPTGYGGIERAVATLCTELVRQKHEVTLIAPSGSCLEGVEVIGTSDFVEATNIANSISADVVHDHTVWDGQSPVRQGLRHPHISTTHVNHAIGFSRNVIYMSKSQRVAHGKQLGKDLSASPVIPCPIDPNLKQKGLSKAEYLLFIGMVAEWKGVYEAAQVARWLNRKLMIAGPAAGEYADKIAHDFPEVVWLGEVTGDYKHELIEQAYAVMNLFNSYGGWLEPGNGVAGESMALGTPIAALHNGCLQEQVYTGENGWITHHPEELPELMTELPYPTNFAPFQQAWSAENIVKSYVNLYEAVCNGATWG